MHVHGLYVQAPVCIVERKNIFSATLIQYHNVLMLRQYEHEAATVGMTKLYHGCSVALRGISKVCDARRQQLINREGARKIAKTAKNRPRTRKVERSISKGAGC